MKSKCRVSTPASLLYPYYQPSSPNNLPLSTCIETYQVVNDVPLDNKVRNEHDDPFTDLQLGLCE